MPNISSFGVLAAHNPAKQTCMKIKFPLIIVLCMLIGAMAYFGYQVHTLSARQKHIKEDFSTVNNISFGLLSVNQWKDKVAAIVDHQIQGFDFNPEQRKNLQKEIEQILHALINKALAMINKPQKTFKGKIAKVAVNAFVDEKELHQQVPGFAKEIIKQINKPSSKKRLKSLAKSKIDELEKTTFDSSIKAEIITRTKIYRRYGVKTEDDYLKKTKILLDDIQRLNYNYTYAMLGCVAVFLLLWWLLRKHTELHKTLFILSIIGAGILLIIGVSSAMIDVEARIKTLDFELLGEHIVFKDQILFFQSKSILDVVSILVTTGKFDSVIVGALIFCFSVLFPLSKLSTSIIYLLGHKKWMRGKVVHYFAFNSGKWSMADVMVVAIMMTYIGFNGILDSQLASLNIKNDFLNSVTTNNTALQPGYILFVGFVMFGLTLSEILKRVVMPAIEHQNLSANKLEP